MPAPEKLTRERRIELIGRYLAGQESTKALLSEFGVTAPYIWIWLSKTDILCQKLKHRR